MAYAGQVHWTELLFNQGRARFLHTPNINLVTYHLMIEDERQRRIEANKQKAADKSAGLINSFNADAELMARYRAKGLDFFHELAAVKIEL